MNAEEVYDRYDSEYEYSPDNARHNQHFLDKMQSCCTNMSDLGKLQKAEASSVDQWNHLIYLGPSETTSGEYSESLTRSFFADPHSTGAQSFQELNALRIKSFGWLSC